MLEIRPSPFLKDIDIGEEITYNIDITGELDGNLVSSHTYHVYNGTGVDVTFSMAGGSAESDGVIAFVCNKDFFTKNPIMKFIYWALKVPAVSFGTLMEIVYAHSMNKEIYIIVLSGHEEHPWLQHHAKKVFKSVNELIEYMNC